MSSRDLDNDSFLNEDLEDMFKASQGRSKSREVEDNSNPEFPSIQHNHKKDYSIGAELDFKKEKADGFELKGDNNILSPMESFEESFIERSANSQLKKEAKKETKIEVKKPKQKQPKVEDHKRRQLRDEARDYGNQSPDEKTFEAARFLEDLGGGNNLIVHTGSPQKQPMFKSRDFIEENNHSFEEDFRSHDPQEADEDRQKDVLRIVAEDYPARGYTNTFEQSSEFISDRESYLDRLSLGHDTSKRYDDSALAIKPYNAEDLSQIMNPNVAQILEDSEFEVKHWETKRTQDFLRLVFINLERKLQRSSRYFKEIAFSRFNHSDERSFATTTDERNIRQQKAERFLKKMQVLCGIYEKVKRMKAVTIWFEVMLREREYEKKVADSTQIFTFILGYKIKDLQRLALLKFLQHRRESALEEEKVIEKQAEIIRRQETFIKFSYMLNEFYRRLENNRKAWAVGKIKHEAANPYGGTRRNNDYHKKSALMLLAHLFESKVQGQKQNTLHEIADYTKAMDKNPKKLLSQTLAKRLRNPLFKIASRNQGHNLMSILKVAYSKKVRTGYTQLFEVLQRNIHRKKREALTDIAENRVESLKDQMRVTRFLDHLHGAFNGASKRNLQNGLNEIARAARVAKIKSKNAVVLALKLHKYYLQSEAEAFNRIKKIPELAAKFYYQNMKFKKSEELRGAMKIFHIKNNKYQKEMVGKIRRTFLFLRRWTAGFKRPVYHQRLLIFVDSFERRRKEKLAETFYLLNCKGVVYELQRYLQNSVNLTGQLNASVKLALSNNIKSNDQGLDSLTEFWNIRYDIDAPKVYKKS